MGQSLSPGNNDAKLFQGRDSILAKIKGSFRGNTQSERYYIDGVRRVGKTSLINYLPGYIPGEIIPVHIEFDLQTTGVRGPIDSAAVLHNFCIQLRLKCYSDYAVELSVPSIDMFKEIPGKTFQSFLSLFRSKMPGKTPLLIIDEFQDLLHSIALSGTGKEQDTLVLGQLRGLLDKGHLCLICTGSVRFNYLSKIVNHRFFGALTTLPTSFLSLDSVVKVLRAGFEKPVKILMETIKRVYELTGGYPWLVQQYGSELGNLLNEEHRIVSSPEDVDLITAQKIVPHSEYFKFWWPVEQLTVNEAKFIKFLFSEFHDEDSISIERFFNHIPRQENITFKKALQTLRSCEVLDSTDINTVKFRGTVLRQWLKSQLEFTPDLHIKPRIKEKAVKGEKVGIFVDHVRFFNSLKKYRSAKNLAFPDGQQRLDWFASILKKILAETKNRFRNVNDKVTVGFWSCPDEAPILSAYYSNGFKPKMSEDINNEKTLDIQLKNEFEIARKQALKEHTELKHIIIVSGEGPFAHLVRPLRNDFGIDVQIWGLNLADNPQHIMDIDNENIVAIEDICSGLLDL